MDKVSRYIENTHEQFLQALQLSDELNIPGNGALVGPTVNTMTKYKYKFEYSPGLTVTVRKAKDLADATKKACRILDKRYEKRNLEPPVEWTLTLIWVIVEKYINYPEYNGKL